MRRPREQFDETSNLALALAAALHTAGDIRTGASFQSGYRDRPLHNRPASLRGVHLLYDAGKRFARIYIYRVFGNSQRSRGVPID